MYSKTENVCLGNYIEWCSSILFIERAKALSWQLQSMKEAGLYPIVPVERDWFLDKGRLHLQLMICRHQLLLTPAFKMTAPGRPNRTLPGSCAVRAMAAGTNCHPSTPFCPPSACAVQARSFVSNGLITRGHGGLRDVTALVDREHFHHFPNLFGGMRGYSDRIFEYNRVCSPGFESAAMFAERAAQQPVFQADR